jgi:hypothetical protein
MPHAQKRARRKSKPTNALSAFKSAAPNTITLRTNLMTPMRRIAIDGPPAH